MRCHSRHAIVVKGGGSGSLAEAITPGYRALLLLAMFSSLRWGELAALRRSDIDLEERTVRVTRRASA
jgi:integrase